MLNLRENWARLRHFRERQRVSRYLAEASAQHRQGLPQIAHFAFDHLGVQVELDGRYDRAMLDFLLPLIAPLVRDRTLVDVGANVGNHAVAFASVAKCVVALEPAPRTFRLLAINAELCPNIVALPLGASDLAGKARAPMPKGNPGWASISSAQVGEGEEVVEFDLVRLDDVPNLKSDQIGVLKIDVKGHEAAVIRGATTMIARDRPLILFEQWASEIGEGTSPAVEELRNLGYVHLCSVEPHMQWKVPDRLSGPLRRLGRLMEAVVLGMPQEQYRLVTIDRLERRDYPALVATVDPSA